MISATSASQRTDSSKAFLSSPFLRFEKVTCLLVAFSMRFIWVFPLTIFSSQRQLLSQQQTKKGQIFNKISQEKPKPRNQNRIKWKPIWKKWIKIKNLQGLTLYEIREALREKRMGFDSVWGKCNDWGGGGGGGV